MRISDWSSDVCSSDLPTLHALTYEGAERARLAPPLRELLASPRLAGVIVCPSNPYLSLAPMLAFRELRETLRAVQAPVIAVSPIVAGEAIKGPTAKTMRELDVQPHAGILRSEEHTSELPSLMRTS